MCIFPEDHFFENYMRDTLWYKSIQHNFLWLIESMATAFELGECAQNNKLNT